MYCIFCLFIHTVIVIIAIKKLWYEKAKFGIVYKNIYYECTGKQMNPEHECNMLNLISSH